MMPYRFSTLFAFLLVVFARPVLAQDADALVNETIEALGGIENIMAIETMKISGTVEMPSMDQEMEIRMERKRPMKTRSEVYVPSVGATITSAYDGETAWMINTMSGGGATEVTGPQAEQVMRNSEFDSPLIGYEQKGMTVEYAGEETVDGASTKKIKLTRPDSSVTTFFVDDETKLVTRMETEGQNPMTTQPATVVTTLTDYRDVGGYMMPFKMSVSVDDTEFQVITFDGVTVNQPIPDTRFAMPTAESKTGGNW